MTTEQRAVLDDMIQIAETGMPLTMKLTPERRAVLVALKCDLQQLAGIKDRRAPIRSAHDAQH